MGCPKRCALGANLLFSICTHDPDTGVLTDADSAPAYRIYEDETATPIATGTMAALDATNTTGFYTELITVKTLNGYEAEKTYTIYIEATVDGDKGGISFAFKAVMAIWAEAISGTVIIIESLAKDVEIIESLGRDVTIIESLSEEVKI